MSLDSDSEELQDNATVETLSGFLDAKKYKRTKNGDIVYNGDKSWVGVFLNNTPIDQIMCFNVNPNIFNVNPNIFNEDQIDIKQKEKTVIKTYPSTSTLYN